MQTFRRNGKKFDMSRVHCTDFSLMNRELVLSGFRIIERLLYMVRYTIHVSWHDIMYLLSAFCFFISFDKSLIGLPR